MKSEIFFCILSGRGDSYTTIVHFTIQCTLYTVENLDLFAKYALCIHGHWTVYKLYNLYNI